jgi:hypothetical protein
MYVPGKLIVRGDAAATASNITAHETLFRAGIVAGLISAVIFLFTVMALHELLKGVNQRRAAVMVALVVVCIPINFVNDVSNLAALTLLGGAEFLSVFSKGQLDALAMFFLRLHGLGPTVSMIFWGLWLFPFGMLVYRSRFLPRILGVWLVINGLAYVAISLTGLLLPDYRGAVFRAMMPVLFGEIAIALWLVIMGAKEQLLDDHAP